MFWSFCYLALRCLFQLLLLRPRSEDFKELEIVVLRHELSVLRRQAARPQLRSGDRVFLAAASLVFPVPFSPASNTTFPESTTSARFG